MATSAMATSAAGGAAMAAPPAAHLGIRKVPVLAVISLAIWPPFMSRHWGSLTPAENAQWIFLIVLGRSHACCMALLAWLPLLPSLHGPTCFPPTSSPPASVRPKRYPRPALAAPDFCHSVLWPLLHPRSNRDYGILGAAAVQLVCYLIVRCAAFLGDPTIKPQREATSLPALHPTVQPLPHSPSWFSTAAPGPSREEGGLLGAATDLLRLCFGAAWGVVLPVAHGRATRACAPAPMGSKQRLTPAALLPAHPLSPAPAAASLVLLNYSAIAVPAPFRVHLLLQTVKVALLARFSLRPLCANVLLTSRVMEQRIATFHNWMALLAAPMVPPVVWLIPTGGLVGGLH